MITVCQFDVTAERLRRARVLFEMILTKEKAAGAAWLAKECDEDDELRTMVERMLEADHQACPILDQRFAPTPEFISSGSGALKPGDTVGAYRIVREIGVGGMGSVYQAELVEPRSGVLVTAPVAIKVVRWYSREIWRRFEQEQLILRGLRHPKIARLLDSGVLDSGSPYFVMEYVDGKPIHLYCEENGLSIEDRIRLFRQVCEAVSYLHRNLVIHRDLKPGNVLVTADGGIRLVDFGIAKLLHAADGLPSPIQTIAGSMTPDYASPEQIRGGATSTLTDVYSLGVMLYELLTGQRPFSEPSEHIHETLRRICEEEPRKPSLAAERRRQDRGRKLLCGELDNILLKAIRKEPERRYSSADQFGEDLQNYLEGQPVVAQGDSVWYRARKFAVRHNGVVAAGVAVLAALTAGIAVSSMEARVARQERTRAEAQTREANRAKQIAEEQRSEANAQRAGAIALRTLAEQRALDADRERAKADRRLEKLEELARGEVRIYDANKEAGNDASAVIAENVRDSLLTLQRERRLQPGLADALDRSSATRQSYELATDPLWDVASGWLATESKPGEYRIGKDHLVVHSGKSSLFLRSLATHPEGTAAASQIFGARSFRGKRVQLTAFLRTEAVAGRVYLGLVASGQGSRVLVRGTTSWKQYSVVMDVPLEAEELRFILMLQGAGTLWADDLGFEQVSKSVPLSTQQPENLSFTANQ